MLRITEKTKKEKKQKKFVSALLVGFMVFSTIPAPAFAELSTTVLTEEHPTGGVVLEGGIADSAPNDEQQPEENQENEIQNAGDQGENLEDEALNGDNSEEEQPGDEILNGDNQEGDSSDENLDEEAPNDEPSEEDKLTEEEKAKLEEEQKKQEELQKARALMRANYAASGYEITGGELGEDYLVESNVVKILTSTPLTFSTEASTTYGIQIEPTVEADITLSGVTITCSAPINLMADSKCHITLADGTTNTLNAGNNGTAALHCGQGSVLVIDDEVLNIDAAGNPVVPVNGKIGADVLLSNGTQLQAGDPLSRLSSSNPGTLIAKGGKNSAAIGGGPAENSGNMTFEGGCIYAYAWGGNNNQNANGGYSTANDSSGAGIGGGAYNGGGTDMTFNAAEIHAYASYHGAGIGAGWSSGSSSTKQPGASSAAANGVCGNITINGGYLTSQGYDHGNAFGQGCGTTAAGCTIKVTGGTLLPSSLASRFDIGGTSGKVIITGGSVRVSGKGKFQSGDNNNALGADGNPVFMMTIDLAAEGLANESMENWKLLIGGQEMEYGAPSMLDEGRLYLWLPNSVSGKTVTVDLAVKKADGEVQPVDPLFVENTSTDGSAILKRYIDFELPEEYTGALSKDYDGLPFEKYDLAQNPVTTQEDHPKQLDKNEDVSFKFQLYDEQDGVALGEEHESTKMPCDAGMFKVVMISKQYAKDPAFANSYWGHRATTWAEIKKVPAKMFGVKYDAEHYTDDKGEKALDFMTLHASVRPADGNATTCAAPDGFIQFYINGIKVGNEINLSSTDGTIATIEEKTDEAGYQYKEVTTKLQFKDNLNYPRIIEADEFELTAKYFDGTNYTDCNGKMEEEDIEDVKGPEDFPYVTVPIPVITPVISIDGDINEDGTVKGDISDPTIIIRQEDDVVGGTHILHSYDDSEKTSTVTQSRTLEEDEVLALMNNVYKFVEPNKTPLKDQYGNDIVIDEVEIYKGVVTAADLADGVELSEPIDEINLATENVYSIVATVTNQDGNKTTVILQYHVKKSEDLAGEPIDTDGDGKADVNIDLDNDNKPDLNIDTTNTGKPNVNVDIDGDGKPDLNIDTNGDGKPDLNIVDKDGDGIPDDIVPTIKTDEDGNEVTDDEGNPIKEYPQPNINVDIDGDGNPDLNVDVDVDGEPDLNVVVDKEGNLVEVPSIDPETGEPKYPAPTLNIVVDEDGNPTGVNPVRDKDGKPKTDEDGKIIYENADPTVNVDTNDDSKPDLNVDTNGDGKPDLNIVDKDGVDEDGTPNGKPDGTADPIKPTVDEDGNLVYPAPNVNVDTNDDGKPDLNVDTDKDGKPDIDIVDKDGDGVPDEIVPTVDEDGKPVYPAPDVNVDTNNDGEPDLNVDTNGDGKPDINIVDKDGDGKPDEIVPTVDEDGKPVHPAPDVNVDVDGDGVPDLNVDTNGDGKPDVNIVDEDGDGKPDEIVPTEETNEETGETTKTYPDPTLNIVDKDGDGEWDKGIGAKKDEDGKIIVDDEGKPVYDTDENGNIIYPTPDVNIDTDGDGKADVNIDTDGDGKPDANIDTDGDGKPDKNIIGASNNSGGGGGSSYTVVTDKTEHGSITVSSHYPSKGSSVTITVKPDAGFQLNTLTITDNKGNKISYKDNGDGTYTYIQPSGKVTVAATFKVIGGMYNYHDCPRNEYCPIWPFTDASPQAWYHEGVHYCIDNGLMNGYGNNIWGPNNNLSRAMMAQILYNMTGRPEIGNAVSFDDVKADAWYANVVSWAVNNGVARGYGKGLFGPNDDITREQFVCMLRSYAEFLGYDVSELGDVSKFKDKNKISDYAEASVRWAVGNGLLAGKEDNLLDPTGTTTRAEAATIVMRFREGFAK